MPPLIFPGGTSTGTGTTFKSAWRAVADELGEAATITAASEAAMAVHPDADRQILSEQLTADQKNPRRFDGFWAYVVDGAHAGETRMVLEMTFDGPYGSLLLDRRFLHGGVHSEPLAENTEVDLTSPLPVGRHLTIKGLQDCVREAAKLIDVDTRLSLTGDGTRAFPLSSYGFIRQGDQVDAIYERWDSTQPFDRPSRNAGTIIRNGAELTLVTDLAITSGTGFQVRIIRKADTLIKSGGVWSDSTTGPVNADDELPVPPQWIKAFGMVKALRACVTMTRRDRSLSAEEKAERIGGPDGYLARLQVWARACVRIIESEEYPRPTAYQSPALVSGTTDRYDGGPEVIGRDYWL